MYSVILFSDGIKCWTCSSTGSTKATCGANFDKTSMVSEECGDTSCAKIHVVWEEEPAQGMSFFAHLFIILRF